MLLTVRMPTPQAIPVDLGFEVADGEDVRLNFQQESLVVTFTDWHEETVSFVCEDTVAFRWQEGEYLLDPAERDDSVYEITHSLWVGQHQDQGCLPEGRSFHHFKMNFNAAGVFEVLCSKIEKRPN